MDSDVMTVDREQIRRDELREGAATLKARRQESGLWSPIIDFHDRQTDAILVLLAELEQAEKWANTMEHERDWERDVVHSELLSRAETAEARLEQADQTNATLTRRLTDQRHRAENAEVRASKPAGQ